MVPPEIYLSVRLRGRAAFVVALSLGLLLATLTGPSAARFCDAATPREPAPPAARGVGQ